MLNVNKIPKLNINGKQQKKNFKILKTRKNWEKHEKIIKKVKNI